MTSALLAEGRPQTANEDHAIAILASEGTPKEEWLRVIPLETRKVLRIHRFACRVSSKLEDDPSYPNGRPDVNSSRLLVSVFAFDLADLERSISPMSPLVAIEFGIAKLQLHVVTLHADPREWRSEDVVACYMSAILVIRTIGDYPSPSQWLDNFTVYLVICAVRGQSPSASSLAINH